MGSKNVKLVVDHIGKRWKNRIDFYTHKAKTNKDAKNKRVEGYYYNDEGYVLDDKPWPDVYLDGTREDKELKNNMWNQWDKFPAHQILMLRGNANGAGQVTFRGSGTPR